MLSLEQVKLLESKVTVTIEYVKKVSAENSQLKEKLTSSQKRIEELEALVQQLKANHSRIEDGILSALNRLNQFEDALEGKLPTGSKLPVESKLPTESKLQTPIKAAQGKKEEKESDINGELGPPPEQGSEELSEETSSGEQSSLQELDIF